MSRLLIGNWGNEAEVANIPADELHHAGSQGQRMIWGAQPEDAVILPIRPDPAFLDYVSALIGVDAGSLESVGPPAENGDGVLPRARYEEEEFVPDLERIVRDRGIDRPEPFYLDGYVNLL